MQEQWRNPKTSEEFDRSSQGHNDDSEFPEDSKIMVTPGDRYKNRGGKEISTKEFMQSNTYQCLVKGKSTLEYLTRVNKGLLSDLRERENSTKNLMQYANRLMGQEKKLNEKVNQMKVQNDMDLEKIE